MMTAARIQTTISRQRIAPVYQTCPPDAALTKIMRDRLGAMPSSRSRLLR